MIAEPWLSLFGRSGRFLPWYKWPSSSCLKNVEGERAIVTAETAAEPTEWPHFSLPKQTLIQWSKVSFLSSTLRVRRVTLLFRSKYCSWEPGHSRRAGALAVVTVAELLRNSDASSTERKEGDLEGRWWYLYRTGGGANNFHVLGLYGRHEV